MTLEVSFAIPFGRPLRLARIETASRIGGLSKTRLLRICRQAVAEMLPANPTDRSCFRRRSLRVLQHVTLFPRPALKGSGKRLGSSPCFADSQSRLQLSVVFRSEDLRVGTYSVPVFLTGGS
jgi:hypothetical protein